MIVFYIAIALVRVGLFTAMGFGVYMLARNEWVYKQRMKMLRSSMREYYKLPSYDTMLNRLWVWDVKKFLR